MRKKQYSLSLLLLLLAFSCAKVDELNEDNNTPGVSTITVDASGTNWVYASLRTGQSVNVADAPGDTDKSSNLDWDIGFRGAKMRTNSGASGNGQGGAADPSVTNLEQLNSVPTTFETDIAASVSAGPPPAQTIHLNTVLYGCSAVAECSAYEGWYNYDSSTHTISPKDKVFVLRSADGQTYFKFKIKGYASGVYSIDYQKL